MGEIWENLFPRGFSRSPWFPILVVGVLILGPGLAWHLHQRGRFSTLKRKIRTQLNSTGRGDLDAGRPGGLDAMVLTRTASAGDAAPEFVSATFLPGMGMTFLQITANVPGSGEVSLLASPSVQAVSAGAVEPPNGFMDDHGAIELPWGGALLGAPTPLGTTVIANWLGHSIEETTDGSAQPTVAEGGTLQLESADGNRKEATPDGMKGVAIYRNVNTDDRWPSKTDVTVSAQLDAKAIELVVTAKNTGDRDEPMGIGWHPRFAIGNGTRKKIQLGLPNGQVMEIEDTAKELPSGKFLEAPAEVARYEGPGATLGESDLDAALVNLKTTAPGSGPAVELRNAAAGFGVRLTALSTSIREVRVVAPAEGGYVSVGMQSNYGDPFGKEWAAKPEGGIAVLAPGQSMEWRVRLEIFPVAKQ
jgi:aldose 1-epimerase